MNKIICEVYYYYHPLLLSLLNDGVADHHHHNAFTFRYQWKFRTRFEAITKPAKEDL
jgi:hypothetical protein